MSCYMSDHTFSAHPMPMGLQLKRDHQVALKSQAFTSSALLYLANTWICAKAETDCKRCILTLNATQD